MGKITKRFEKEFAKFIGSKYALMVNAKNVAKRLPLKSSAKMKSGKSKLSHDKNIALLKALLVQPNRAFLMSVVN